MDRLVEQGRRRDGTLWRRYLASLLDVPLTAPVPGRREAVEEEQRVAEVPSVSTVFYDLDTTVDVTAAPPGPGRWQRSAVFALAAVLVMATALGVSLGTSGWLADPVPGSPAVAGYHRAKDTARYTIVVPDGWARSEKQAQASAVVYFDAPGDGRQLQIFEVAESTPAESLDVAENDPGFGFAMQPGYRVLERNSGSTWVELVYRYDDEDKGPREVIDHRFEAVDGTLHAIRVSGPASLPSMMLREPLDVAVKSFCPVDAECPSRDLAESGAEPLPYPRK
ncbi:hypothetical protein ABZ848_19085 [Streptomyces sp. NPDC047081]|uniref:hypothetical protein n=1 Tax=Streptomyces sp. NPDC047081 TaxID=3154706 RepID=UPI0033D7286B